MTDPRGRSAGLVDMHAHFLPDGYVAEARSVGIDRPSGMPAWPAWSPRAHLDLMDAAGIASAVLSISAPGILWSPDPVALAWGVNDSAAALCDRYPTRFRFFASLPVLDEAAALAELERALALPGCVGVVLESNAKGRYLGDPSWSSLFAELDRRAAVVFVHPVEPPAWRELTAGRPAPMLEFPFETTRTVADLVLTGTLLRHPHIRFVFPHLGGALPFLADRIQMFRAITGEGEQDPGVREQLGSLWFDLAGTPLPAQLPALLGVVDSDHVVYGSDYCFTPAPRAARHAAALRDEDPAFTDRTTAVAEALLAGRSHG